MVSSLSPSWLLKRKVLTDSKTHRIVACDERTPGVHHDASRNSEDLGREKSSPLAPLVALPTRQNPRLLALRDDGRPEGTFTVSRRAAVHRGAPEMKPPTKMPGRKLPHSIRFSDDEWATFVAGAATFGLEVTRYVRECALTGHSFEQTRAARIGDRRVTA